MKANSALKEIGSRYLETRDLKWRSLAWFQSKELKTMSKSAAKRFLGSLEDLEIIREFRVWEKPSGEIVILDGHHLEMILKVGEEEGLFHVPDVLPCHFVRCKDEQEAAKLVIAYSAVYARMNYEGLDELLTVHQIAVDTARNIAEIPSISFAYWDDPENIAQEIGSNEEPEQTLENIMSSGAGRYHLKKPKIIFAVEAHEYAILLNALRRIMRREDLPSLTDVLKYMVGKEEEIDADETNVL